MEIKVSINNQIYKKYASLEAFFDWIADTFHPHHFNYYAKEQIGTCIYRQDGQTNRIITFQIKP